MDKTILCRTQHWAVPHVQGSLSRAMHIQMHPIEKKHKKPNKTNKKITPLSPLQIFSTDTFNSNTPAIIHHTITIKKLSAFALGN